MSRTIFIDNPFLFCYYLIVFLPPKKNLKSSFSLPLQGEAGGKGVRGEFRPPSQSRAKPVRIFSNTHRQFTISTFLRVVACPRFPPPQFFVFRFAKCAARVGVVLTPTPPVHGQQTKTSL
jgi:hypothetical protein